MFQDICKEKDFKTLGKIIENKKVYNEMSKSPIVDASKRNKYQYFSPSNMKKDLKSDLTREQA